MELIKISHLTKTYKTSNSSSDVLKDVSLTLPDNGLVTILGRSGSGKSTLLNIIGGIDKPSKGKIIIANKQNPLIFRKSFLSFIFQHYHLLENETPLYNVMLPALIHGINKKLAEKQAKELLSNFGLDENVINKETRLLSGGEKERIAILRALITNPRVILADEPTGALDRENAIKTNNILKNASKNRLVVLVTHNNDLAREYSDRIITLSDGKIVNDELINTPEQEIYFSKGSRKYKNDWTSTIINHNYKKRFKRHIVSILGMTVSLIFTYLLFGFSSQSNKAINEISCKHFDYGTSVLNKQIKTETNSSISLVRTLRPSLDEIDDIKTKLPYFSFMPNYDAVFNSGRLFLNNKECEEITNSYVLDFSSNCFDNSLLNNKTIDITHSWNDVVVNKKAKDLIKDKTIHYRVSYEYTYEIDTLKIVDYFEIEEKLNVISVADEFDFLAVPKIYFDYQKIDELFENKILDNLSDFKREEISWKALIKESSPGDKISSYSMKCFLTDIDRKEDVSRLSNYLANEVKLENDSLTIKEALDSLTTAAIMGLDIFLIISIVGSVLILGVFSFSAYSDDKKESSILSCLGATNSDIAGIFAYESIISAILAFLFATVFSWIIESPINRLLEKLIKIPNLIKIPFSSYLGIKGLLPIGIFFITIAICIIFSSVPIYINKTISVKKELADL